MRSFCCLQWVPRGFAVTVLLLAASLSVSAQLASPSSPGSITGTVADPTGAVIPQATITVSRGTTVTTTATSDGVGHFSVVGLAPGAYEVQAQTPGFNPTDQLVKVAPGITARIILTLTIRTDQQEVIVSADALDTSPDKNGGALVLKGDDLQSLSDDPDELQTQLQSIAGTDPETGTQFYVDGFSSGKLPPKSAIREIRVNQNPYSAQYDSLGYGRIEILTKPGADKLHGDYWMQGNDSPWNALSPFVSSQPPYHSYQLDSDVNGPINKSASYFLSVYHQNAINDAIINAEVLDGSLHPTAFTEAITTPSTSLYLAPRVDIQAGKIHTLSVRYQLSRNTSDNAGVGQFELASQGYNSQSTEQILQLSDSQAYGTHVLNETRFQYTRDRSNQTPQSLAPTLAVQGAFTGGGSNTGINRDAQDHYEFQNYVRIDHKAHDFNFGVRLRGMRDSNYSTANFNGQYTFASLNAYQITVQGMQNGLSPAAIRAAGGGASLFSQTEGTPSVAVTMIDTGLFAEDNLKFEPSVTLSYGLRFETQTGIHDHADFGPRIGLAWSIQGPKNKPPRAVIRSGFGLFYQRFSSTGLIQAQRQNGIMEHAVVVNAPDFYPDTCGSQATACSSGAQLAPTIYRIDPTLRAPYTLIAGIGVDKPIGKLVTVSANYLYSRGDHQFLTRNINAPLPGTYSPSIPDSGTRPLGIDENIYEYQSEGTSDRNRLVINGNLHAKHSGLFGFYSLSKTEANTAGLGSFPSNQYDLRQDYGRASYDIRNRAVFGGYTRLPYNFSINPFLVYQSSSPFNIVVGQDLNGDTQFNDRPAFATDLTRSSVVRTKWGTFDTNPMAGQRIIPVNYGKGPGVLVANLRVNRSFNFGPKLPDEPGPQTAPANAKDAKTAGKTPAKAKKKEIERKYTWSIGVSAKNVLNHPNLAQPVGVLGSPLFGKSTALANVWGNNFADRSVYLETFFRF